MMKTLYDQLMASPGSFTEALDGATLPGFSATVESDLAGRFVVWRKVRAWRPPFPGPAPEAPEVYATPGWSGATGISVCIHGGGRVWTDRIDVDAWADDGVQNAHIYLAAVRGWLLQLPRIYGRWDGVDDSDFDGTVIDWVERFHDTNLFDTEFEPLSCSRTGPVGDDGGGEEGPFFTAIEHLDVDWIADNCHIRGTPHPPVEADDESDQMEEYELLPDREEAVR